MTNTADRNLIVGLDIGTTKVAVLVGEVLPDGELNVIGMGSHASRGMEKGGVNDLDSVVKSLRRAVEEAEMMADCKINEVYTGIAGIAAGPGYVQTAMESMMPGFGNYFVAIALFFFAFTTIVAYYYIAETNIAFVNRKINRPSYTGP